MDGPTVEGRFKNWKAEFILSMSVLIPLGSVYEEESEPEIHVNGCRRLKIKDGLSRT